jgi:hypothetical protein
MKKALAVGLAAVLIGVCTGGAMAQNPYMQIYFNSNVQFGSYTDTQSDCGTGMQDVYLVAHNMNMFVQAVEFIVSFPPALIYLSDTPNLPTIYDLVIGNANVGEAIAYNLPQNGFVPMLLTTISVFWAGNCDCLNGPQALVVGPYPGQLSPRAVEWPSYVAVDVVGMTSLVCPGVVSTEQKTWGSVKALYR